MEKEVKKEAVDEESPAEEPKERKDAIICAPPLVIEIKPKV